MSLTMKRLLWIGGIGILLNIAARAFTEEASRGGNTFIMNLPGEAWACGLGAICTGTAAAILASKRKRRIDKTDPAAS